MISLPWETGHRGILIDKLLSSILINKADTYTGQELKLTSLLWENFRSQWHQTAAANPAAFDILLDPASYKETGNPNAPLELKPYPAKKFHSQFAQALGPDLEKQIRNGSKTIIDNMYQTAAKTAAAQSGLSTWDLSSKDQKTIDVIHRDLTYWVEEKCYPELSQRINNAAEKTMESGLGRTAMAHELQQNLNGTIDRSIGYWHVVASANLGRSRNFAHVNTYQRGGIAEYEIINPMDERTSQICQAMNGKVFTVDMGMTIVEEVINTQDPEDIKAGQPWMVWDGGRNGMYKQQDPERHIVQATPKQLSKAGVVLPPFHGRCRSTTVISVKEVITPGISAPVAQLIPEEAPVIPQPVQPLPSEAHTTADRLAIKEKGLDDFKENQLSRLGGQSIYIDEDVIDGQILFCQKINGEYVFETKLRDEYRAKTHMNLQGNKKMTPGVEIDFERIEERGDALAGDKSKTYRLGRRGFKVTGEGCTTELYLERPLGPDAITTMSGFVRMRVKAKDIKEATDKFKKEFIGVTKLPEKALSPRTAAGIENLQLHQLAYQIDPAKLEALIAQKTDTPENLIKVLNDNGRDWNKIKKTITVNQENRTYASFRIDRQREMAAAGITDVVQYVPSPASIVQIIKNGGAVSTAQRFRNGSLKKGSASLQNLYVGSGDTVFATMIGKQQQGADMSQFGFGLYCIHYDTKILNRTDWYGLSGMNLGAIRGRSSPGEDVWGGIGKFIKKNDGGDEIFNELMFRNSIGLESMTGITVPEGEFRENVISQLKKEGIKEVNGIPLNEFIKVDPNAANTCEIKAIEEE